MEGTNKTHENGEAMGFVGVRLTAQLGQTPFVERMDMNASAILERAQNSGATLGLR